MTFAGLLPDRRLVRRADRLLAAMVTLRTTSIAALARNWAEQMAFYRLLSNTSVRPLDLAAGLCRWMANVPPLRKTIGRVPGEAGASERPHFLVIQDTTEVSFDKHRGRIRDTEGLGWLSNNRRFGYCMHPALVVDAHRGGALGFADVRLWWRAPDSVAQDKMAYRDLPIEQKESMRWIEVAQAAAERLHAWSPSALLTIIGDRQADLYSLFARLPSGCAAVIRACRTRRLVDADADLFTFLQAQPVLGTELVWIRGDIRRGEQGRYARLLYRSAAVTIKRPERSSKPNREGVRDARQLRLWAVEVTEQERPSQGKPICWRLLTTHPAGMLEEAQQVCAWYRQRWYIEQVFRLMKSDGLTLEESELESAQALQKLGVLALGAAFEVMRLMLAERSGSEEPVEVAFDESEQHLLDALNQRLEGPTQKQRNPHEQHTLAWAAWVVARLGGWAGYASQHKAGPATYHRGLERFRKISEGWHLAHEDLYKP